MIFRTKRKITSYEDAIDASEKGQFSSYSLVMKLKHNNINLWKALDNINKFLYNQDLSTIKQKKPIFDDQKRQLIVMDNWIEKFYKIGLVTKYNKVSKVSTLKTNHFITKTEFSNWDNLANESNNLINQINEVISSEMISENIIETFNKKTIAKKSNFIYKLIIFLVMLVILLYVFYEFIL